MTVHRKPRRHVIEIDHAFDQLAPVELRHLSHRHWTPVGVAVRAAALLTPTVGMQVLDVGAGIGKVCAVGALSAQATWCGIERHASLVTVATRLTRALGVSDHVRFIHGDALALDWDEFDAIYLYNPFHVEPFADDPTARDRNLQIAMAEDRLARLRVGVRVVTFRGFGGVMPPTYQLVYQELVRPFDGDLVLWVQQSRACRATRAS